MCPGRRIWKAHRAHECQFLDFSHWSHCKVNGVKRSHSPKHSLSALVSSRTGVAVRHRKGTVRVGLEEFFQGYPDDAYFAFSLVVFKVSHASTYGSHPTACPEEYTAVEFLEKLFKGDGWLQFEAAKAQRQVVTDLYRSTRKVCDHGPYPANIQQALIFCSAEEVFRGAQSTRTTDRFEVQFAAHVKREWAKLQ